MTKVLHWSMTAPRAPFTRGSREEPPPGPGQALVRVAGCGVCHTDLGFWLGDVKTNHPLPLVLGHEVSGFVEAAGEGAEDWLGRAVIVPAVMPCGECRSCTRGLYALCPKQVFPGNDVHGGFASHLVVPARWLCTSPESDPARLALHSVVADAVSTPYEAIQRSGLLPGNLAVFVGAGGVGGFGVQIAAALGATVAAIDPDGERRDQALKGGAALALDPKAQDIGAMRRALRELAKQKGLPSEEWKIFETSGTAAGQETAFALLVRGSHLGIVGFTPSPASVVVSRLMALDARAVGNWGCAPERYPEVVALVASGRIAIEPFVDVRPMSGIDGVFTEMAEHRMRRRAVLVPDFA